MTPGPATDFLFSLERFGMKFGLANMAALCESLDHPERTFPSILIAGTNGKGSVAAMVDAALTAQGYTSGRYTSPHLQHLEERFAIGGRDVGADRLEASATRIRAAVDALLLSGQLEALPTFFECTTAVAFDLFREARVDAGVLEVGLGGRLDATNVVTPVATAIVSIDFDHQAQLGDTRTSIAAEKAGIIKPGIPVVCGAMPPDALEIIARAASECAAPLVVTGGDAALADRVAAIPLALAGAHQRLNAAVALRLLEVLDADPRHGLRVDEPARRAGLATARWPGRLETLVYRERPLLLDAAHNPAGARALASYLLSRWPDGVTLVFGAMKDKAVAEMLQALAPAARQLVCTTAPTPRAMTSEALLDIARALELEAAAVDDPMAAVDCAYAASRPVVVAGSIFLLGAVRERVLA